MYIYIYIYIYISVPIISPKDSLFMQMLYKLAHSKLIYMILFPSALHGS